VPAEKRLCQLGCVGAVEDEKHFLLSCTLFESRRKKLKEDINMLVRMQGRKENNAHLSDNKRRMDNHQQVELHETHIRMNCDVQHEQCAEMAMSDMESEDEMSDSDSESVPDRRSDIQHVHPGHEHVDEMNTQCNITRNVNEFDCDKLPEIDMIRILLGGEHNQIHHEKSKLQIQRMIMVELSEWMNMKQVEEEKRQLLECANPSVQCHSQS
jgi:hypothetical protein